MLCDSQGFGLHASKPSGVLLPDDSCMCQPTLATWRQMQIYAGWA